MSYTQAEIEAALDSGQLFVRMHRPADGCWQCRRNGRTKTWKREPGRFRIPIKFGFRGTGAVDNGNVDYFVIAADRLSAETYVRLTKAA